MYITKEEFKNRRKKVLDYLEDISQSQRINFKSVFKSGSEKVFSNDVKYPFRPDNDFYYLTGFTEPNSILVLDPFSDHPYQLYVQPVDHLHSIWEGHREGISGARMNFAADIAFDLDEFKDDVEPQTKKRSSVTRDLTEFIYSLRSVKSEAELQTMRKAAAISVQAHQVAKEIITPGIYEYELEACLNQVFRSQGANGWAYPPIVASGPNSCVLHYRDNNRKIEKNDLVLIDAGCEYQFYASDITRVHAASGKFSKEQQDVYDIVLEAQRQAIDSIRPGKTLAETHDIARMVIGEGLHNLGYIKDRHDPEQIKKYYMHGTGHSIGMDVHDVGVDKKTSKYIPGMVTTVEPGIYIREKNIGIRIEDDVVVTKSGHEVITSSLDK